MKRIRALALCAALTMTVLFSNSLPAYSSDIVKGDFYINVNGERVVADIPPVTKDDRMMVPLRGVIEKLGGTPEWNDANQMVTITYKDMKIYMAIGNKLALVNNKGQYMDVAPILYNDRTLVPLRFIAEAMGMVVNWVPEANLATITEPTYFEELPATTVLGYTTSYYNGDNTSYNALLNSYNNINEIATFSYATDSKGNLRLADAAQTNTVKFANDNEIRPLMLVHNMSNGSFSRDVAHDVLSNETNRKNLINNILVLLSKQEYAGVNIDIESIYWYDRANYSAFIKELKEALTPYGFLTTVAIPAKTLDTYKNNNWNGAFDYKEIGKYADQILIMTYDEHWAGGDAGPVASYTWVEDVLKYATSVMPSEKILLGLAGYGYDWASTGTKAVPIKNVDSLISTYGAQVKWDGTFKSPYFTYNKNGVSHEVWYENSQSISVKLDFVKKYNLGGIGLWRLGYDNSSFWSVVAGKLAVK